MTGRVVYRWSFADVGYRLGVIDSICAVGYALVMWMNVGISYRSDAVHYEIYRESMV